MNEPAADEVFLACIPRDEATRRLIGETVGRPCVPYRGSAPGACGRCGCAVWVGPQQRQAIARRPAAFVACLPCAAVIMADNPGVEVRNLSAKQFGE